MKKLEILDFHKNEKCDNFIAQFGNGDIVSIAFINGYFEVAIRCQSVGKLFIIGKANDFTQAKFVGSAIAEEIVNEVDYYNTISDVIYAMTEFINHSTIRTNSKFYGFKVCSDETDI